MKDRGLPLTKSVPMESLDPARGRLPYLPALDGLCGVAVLAVLLFHAELSWAVGGHLGVSTFFTLSGFLITGLLSSSATPPAGSGSVRSGPGGHAAWSRPCCCASV